MATTTRHNSLYAFLGVPTPFDRVQTLVTSPVLPPLGLAAVRLSLALYGLVFLLYRIIFEGITSHGDGSFFSYFTNLTYIGLISYFWAAGVQTLAFALSGHKRYPLQTWPKILQFLHMLLLSSVVTFPIVVTLVFWTLLAVPQTLATRYSAWTNISEHALNTVFAAFEIIFTNAGLLSGRPDTFGIPWIHLPFLIAILGCYLGIAYITHATQHFYVYPFLNPQKQHGLLAAYIVGIAVGETIVFLIVRYICLLLNCAVTRITQHEVVRKEVEELSHSKKGDT